MSNIESEHFLNHAGFIHYSKIKNRVNFWLTILLLSSYGIYVGAMAFAPIWMSSPLWNGSAMTTGILLAIILLFSGIICSGLYVLWANKVLDKLKQELLKEFGHE